MTIIAPRHPYPSRAVALIGLTVLLGLLALSPAYGFHRDELYFIVVGQHPAFGYVDQPPLTPLLTAAAVQLLGLHPWAIRILPALAMVACMALAAVTAREMGGTTRAQTIAALIVGGSGFLAAGHLAATATFDVLAWSAIFALVAGILAGRNERLWLAVGGVAGVGLLNKHLVLFLGLGLAVGLLVHRRDVLRTRWPWLALAIALLVWAPNLLWQAANGFPQLEMAQHIAGGASENRAKLVPELLLLAGPLLFPIALAGLVALFRDAALRPFRLIGTTFVAVFVVILATGGKSYYVAGAWPPLMAAGAILVDRWLRRGRRWRGATFAGVTAASAVLVVLLVLPVLPAATFATTSIPDLYKESGEQIGWPELVSTVEGVVDGLTPDQRAHAVVVTSNYGEHGALTLLGSDLPPVYSGHNSLWDFGPPPDDRTVVVLVGGTADWWGRVIPGCEQRATIHNDVGIANDEEDQPVFVCPTMSVPWSQAWPAFRHLD